MNKWLNRANQRISLTGAATLLMVAALFGQILGFIRTQTVNANFPAVGPNSTDAYFAAFKIPDFFFYTIAAGALGVAFMPFLADKLNKGDKKSVWELTSSLLNLLGIIMSVVGIILMVFAEPLIKLVISKNLSPEQLHNAATIMRLIALNPLLFTISGILTSLQQTFGRFFFYALAPILYNVCIIASIYIFKDSIGLVGLGIGALTGAILQLLIVCIGLSGMNFKYHLRINLRNYDFRRILRQLPPRSIDQGIDSINSIVETNRAATLGVGNITYYENAYTLHMAPILLIGTTIATAAFPRLNDRLAQGRPDLFRKDFLRVLQAMIWIILPVVIISFFGRGYFARLIFKRDSGQIALIFGFLAGAIFFRTLYAIISRYFYSHKDTKTPLFVSIFAIALNVFLAFTLTKTYHVAGLAIAQSIVATAEVIILLMIIVWRDHHLFTMEFWNGIVRILSVTGFTMVTAYTMVKLLPLSVTDRGFVTLGTKLFFIVVPTIFVHIAISSLFDVQEAKPVINKLRKLILKPIRIQ
jgi:putative peptidoglycan lipid II flippase